ncbi:MAG: diguanylate cyclase [Spirochaetia bacterium]|nr:diguanylate cyclase [Spirochaetia bacterium]
MENKKILIVDDSKSIRLMLNEYLLDGGHTNIKEIVSGEDVIKYFMDNKENNDNIKLILMDVVMSGMDGLETCQKLKEQEKSKDIPVIITTAQTDDEILTNAFKAGALDYIAKPIRKVELLARVNSAIKLKEEMDKRAKREKDLLEVTKELEKANKILRQISMLDGLTGIANRRSFDITLSEVLNRAFENKTDTGIIMIDIDYFKKYNDSYGHIAGDDCLKNVAQVIKSSLINASQTAARYGGEEFAVVSAETSLDEIIHLAKRIKNSVKKLNIEHKNSEVSDIVTLSIGVTLANSNNKINSSYWIEKADKALYKSKKAGRDKISVLK